jgi:diguanylate cyclase (GGDEF)-like protein
VRLNSKLNLLLALLIGFSLSLFLGRFIYSIETTVITTEFEKDVITESLAIEQEVALNFHALDSLKNFYDNSQHVDPEEFKQFSLALLRSHPNIKALSWVPEITQSERHQYDSKAHYFGHQLHITERNEALNLHTAQQRDVYFPVSYLEPISGNENALGFDLASNPTRLAALTLAKQTGELTITASIQLVQGSVVHKSFLAVLPIYTQHKQSNITDKQIMGYVTAVFHIDELMINALKNTIERDISLTLFDQTTAIVEVLHTTHPEISHNQETRLNYPLGLIGGRTWHLEASPSSSYITEKRSANPFIIFFLVLTFISSSILYIFKLLKQSDFTEQAVQERTIELNEAKQAMERITLLDDMTGVANRRHFDRFLMTEWKRGKREQTPLSLLVIDIDHFKQFNDNYGHLAGDVAIQQVATALSDTLRRPTDLLARYGGEEFAIIAPNTSDGYILAELCRQRIEAALLPHAYSSVADHITVSIGFTTLIPSDDSTPDALFKQADQALYKAKSCGRNQSRAFSSTL